MELSKIITLDRVRAPLQATDKVGVITELVDLLAATGELADRDSALAAVLRRESERTTGIGFGLAIPHGKSGSKVLMSAGKPAVPIDFQSLDRRPVTFVVLLISPPDQTGMHIQALAKVSRLMNIADFRDAIERATTPEELHGAIATYEAREPA